MEEEFIVGMERNTIYIKENSRQEGVMDEELFGGLMDLNMLGSSLKGTSKAMEFYIGL